MCLLMFMRRSPRPRRPLLPRGGYNTTSALFLIFLLQLALIFIFSASSAMADQGAALLVPAAPDSEYSSSSSRPVTAHGDQLSSHHHLQQITQHTLTTTSTQSVSQVPQRLHRRLGFDLEKAYEVLKKGKCKGRSNCRRRPAFHMMHEVPSGPNPISNYLPSKFDDKFSSWAPSLPPSTTTSSP